MRWPRPQPGPSGRPGPVILLAVGLLAFASTFGLARAAGGDETTGSPAGVDAQPLALRTASDLPAMKGEPGPTQAELEAQRAKARERARKRRQAKRREERKAAEEKAAREERLRLRAERRAQRAAEREAEAERKLAAERRQRAQERKRQQEESAPKQPVETTPEAPPPTDTTPTTTTPDGQPFDDSG
jgi:translation initiation factor IF-2